MAAAYFFGYANITFPKRFCREAFDKQTSTRINCFDAA